MAIYSGLLIENGGSIHSYVSLPRLGPKGEENAAMIIRSWVQMGSNGLGPSGSEANPSQMWPSQFRYGV